LADLRHKPPSRELHRMVKKDEGNRNKRSVIRNGARSIAGVALAIIFSLLAVGFAVTHSKGHGGNITDAVLSSAAALASVGVAVSRLTTKAGKVTVISTFRFERFAVGEVASVTVKRIPSPIFSTNGVVEIVLRNDKRIPIRATGTFSERKLDQFKDAVAEAVL
jgi:branched-subunit amino acid permease